MTKRLLLVDLENVHKIDLSVLDETYRAIIYVGAKQNPPKAASKKATAHRFLRADFQKIEGTGKNALDFHIAFQLGRTIETAPETECIVLSADNGFDPLLAHLNKNGLRCRRVNAMAELMPALRWSKQFQRQRRLATPNSRSALGATRPAPSSTTEAAGVPTAVRSPCGLILTGCRRRRLAIGRVEARRWPGAWRRSATCVTCRCAVGATSKRICPRASMTMANGCAATAFRATQRNEVPRLSL